MAPDFLSLVVLFDAAFWLAIAGAVLMLGGLFLPGFSWAHVTSGGITLGLSLTAGTLTALLALQD